ncbi:MAG: ABC transporter substrate-binding protein [Roseibacillus sp.]|nr:ABC transporter substrate-binding protein [Roseibacillus sp.]
MKSCAMILTTLLAILVCGCSREEQQAAGGLGFDEFVPIYNAYIEKWLKEKKSEAEGDLEQAREAIASENDPTNRKRLEGKVGESSKLIARYDYRLELGPYFNVKPSSALPDGLAWQDGLEQPDLGDPACKKGGIFRYYISSFPPTLRPFGPKANNSFRSELYDDMTVSLIDLHRGTGGIMPGVAREWAFSEDKRTIYFKIHEDATYDDGVGIRALDYLISVYIRVSNNVTAPYFKQYLREQFAQWTVYGDHTLAVTTPEPKPPLAAMSNVQGIEPAAPHFYNEYGPDYEERYQWRIPPTTSAYFVKPEDVVKGESITLTRVKDWWAKDKKFYRYRYNTDKLHWRIVRDRNKAWELFRAGELDFTLLSGPRSWYEDSEISDVFDGYIERHWWYNQFPRPPWGLYLNTAKPLLKERDVRLGLAHAMNWQKVIDVVFWGDYSRLPGFVDGYGDLVNSEVQARKFSITKAREYFVKAGFTEEDDKGILKRPDGTRLEITLNYSQNNEVFRNIMAILKDESMGAGVDLILNGLDHSVNYKHEMEKKHEMVCSAWSVQPPYFSFYEYFHSRNAYDEKGNLKFETNNVFTYADDHMDVLTENYRQAATREEKKSLGLEIQQIVHDESLFIPGWSRDFERVGCWRWLRWPDTEHTQFCPKIVSYPYQSYVFWVDEDMQQETLSAIKSGKTFPEVENLVDDYRTVKGGRKARGE